jgi:tellurium resistance protein TerZ
MSMSLSKSDGAADLNGVTALHVGLSWDTSTGGAGAVLGKLRELKGTNLDLLAYAMQGDKPVSYAGLDNQDPEPGIHHTGDNKTGKAAGDDELVQVDFAAVPSEITSILFAVAAFQRGTSFGKAKNVKVRLYDATGGSPTEVAIVRPSLASSSNFMGIARAFRDGSGWKFEVVDSVGNITQGKPESLLRAAMGM